MIWFHPRGQTATTYRYRSAPRTPTGGQRRIHGWALGVQFLSVEVKIMGVAKIEVEAMTEVDAGAKVVARVKVEVEVEIEVRVVLGIKIGVVGLRPPAKTSLWEPLSACQGEAWMHPFLLHGQSLVGTG